jgi:hypothetical protein
MDWTKARRAQRLKQRLSEYNPASRSCLTYEEMLEIAEERERINAEPESLDLKPSSVSEGSMPGNDTV